MNAKWEPIAVIRMLCVIILLDLTNANVMQVLLEMALFAKVSLLRLCT